MFIGQGTDGCRSVAISIAITTVNEIPSVKEKNMCLMPSFVEIGLPVLENKLFEGFLPYTVYVHGCHFDHLIWIIYIHIGYPFVQI